MHNKIKKIIGVAESSGLKELQALVKAVKEKDELGIDVTLDDPDFVTLFGKCKELGILNFQLIQLIKPEAKGDAESEKADTGSLEEKPVLSYRGIRYIGGKYFHESDNYALGFDQAEECAKHYNT